MIQFKKKNISILNYRLILNTFDFFVFFSINTLNGAEIDKLKFFLFLNEVKILTSDAIAYLSSFYVNLYFLKGNFLCCYSKNFNFLLKIKFLGEIFENVDCLFLFYRQFLNLYKLNDLINLVNVFSLSYFYFFLHISICFVFFFFKLFF